MGKTNHYPFKILPEVLAINQHQRKLFLEKVRKAVGNLRGKTLAIWGLSFKPNTDDLREAPSLTIVPALTSQGAKIRAYDPVSMDKAKSLFKKVKYCKNPYEAAQGADAVLILTEWNEFKQIDFNKLRSIVRQPVLVDGRNMYEPQEMAERGFAYHGMGRGEVSQF